MTENVVVITGGASGLGKQVAQRFAARKAKVVLWDINEQALMQVSQMIAAEGGKVWAYTVDVTNKQAVDVTAERVTKEVGRCDIVINNAGLVAGKSLLDLTEQEILNTFHVNVLSHFWIIKAFLPDMLARNKGHICSIASGAALVGLNKLTDYCASKSAVIALDESLRMELKRKGMNGIITTCVSSYFISTGQFVGAKTGNSWLLPILDESYVADRILEAILTNQSEIRMPDLLYYIPLMRFFLSTSTFDKLVNFFGLNNALDDFRSSGVQIGNSSLRIM